MMVVMISPMAASILIPFPSFVPIGLPNVLSHTHGLPRPDYGRGSPLLFMVLQCLKRYQRVNRYIVVVRYSSPAFSTGEGNSGIFTAFG